MEFFDFKDADLGDGDVGVTEKKGDLSHGDAGRREGRRRILVPSLRLGQASEGSSVSEGVNRDVGGIDVS